MCLAAIKHGRRTVAAPGAPPVCGSNDPLDRFFSAANTHGQARARLVLRLALVGRNATLPQDLLHLLAPRQLVHQFVEVADFAHHRLCDLFHTDAADHALDL